MTDRAQQLIDDLKTHGWNAARPYERLFELCEDPGELFGFLKEFLMIFPKSYTLFQDGLSYLDKEQFEELVQPALQLLQKGKHENARNVIDHASLHFPELLHPYLELIFELGIDQETYYAVYSWRNLPEDRILYFKEKLQDINTSIRDKERLFRCLLQTRHTETVQFAFEYAMENRLFDRPDMEEWLIANLEDVGFTYENGAIRRYCPDILRHIIFNEGYFTDDVPVHLSKKHPTWKLQQEETYNFGGVLEDDDANPLFHIITFDPLPQGMNITNLDRLVLGAYISEVNEQGTSFYRHRDDGYPEKIISQEDNNEPLLYADSPIKETTAGLAETPKRWELQMWGPGRQNLFRVGGEPSWIQGSQVPVCPECGRKMDFLMQLDSNLPDMDDDELLFGSGGICYIFWCDASKVSGYLIQHT